MATAPLAVLRLQNTVAPRLPAAPTEYSDRFQEQFESILRLYFNQIDATFAGLLGADPANGTFAGGRFLNFPYASVQRTTDFNWAAANTPALITCNQNDYMNGTSNDGTDGIHVDYAGIYNLQFSIQFANTDTQIHNAIVWFRVNGVDVPGTASKFDVPNKHGGSDGYLIGACNFYLELQPGDYVEMWAAASQVENGVTDGIYMEAYPVQTSPYAHPAIPSVVMTLSFVSALSTRT